MYDFCRRQQRALFSCLFHFFSPCSQPFVNVLFLSENVIPFIFHVFLFATDKWMPSRGHFTTSFLLFESSTKNVFFLQLSHVDAWYFNNLFSTTLSSWSIKIIIKASVLVKGNFALVGQVHGPFWSLALWFLIFQLWGHTIDILRTASLMHISSLSGWGLEHGMPMRDASAVPCFQHQPLCKLVWGFLKNSPMPLPKGVLSFSLYM